jgi:hypothetical protein
MRINVDAAKNFRLTESVRSVYLYHRCCRLLYRVAVPLVMAAIFYVHQIRSSDKLPRCLFTPASPPTPPRGDAGLGWRH